SSFANSTTTTTTSSSSSFISRSVARAPKSPAQIRAERDSSVYRVDACDGHGQDGHRLAARSPTPQYSSLLLSRRRLMDDLEKPDVTKPAPPAEPKEKVELSEGTVRM